jgi:glycosyltransferase involved in cell wall biosynthesis
VKARPRLSIGLPVYNGQQYLGESIEALLNQSYQDFELIISDNASTDTTADICLRYKKNDSRIRYIRQPRNIGLAPNHNFVFQQARGEFFKWAASDDLYGRDLLDCCVTALDENPGVVLAQSYAGSIDGDGKVTQSFEYPLATDLPRAPDRFRSILFGSSGLFTKNGIDLRGIVNDDNDGIIRAEDSYGVMRAEVLRRVAPLGSYHHSDRILICEIALNGPFHTTPQWLHFRREYPGRAYRAQPTVHGRCVILDPARASKLRHPAARLIAEYLWGYVAAISRAPISAAERRECYGHLVQWVVNRAASRVVPKLAPQSPGQVDDAVTEITASAQVVVPEDARRLP